MKSLKGNNKGFSLVELIVVIAIMGILAVTLAPRLTQYVEKARRAADQEVVNSIYTAVKYGMMDEVISTGTSVATIELNDVIDTTNGWYTVTDKNWVADTTGITDPLILEIDRVVGDFKLKSSLADAGTSIELTVTAAGDGYDVSVVLDYDGTVTYTASDDAVRP